MNPIIVIPTAEALTREFQKRLPRDVPYLIVDGSGGKLGLDPRRFDVYDFKRQKKILGSLYTGFRQFQGASSCRNFGHWLAVKQGYNPIFALDYDCYTPPHFIEYHLTALAQKRLPVLTADHGWVNPIKDSGWYSRGFPYEKRFPVHLKMKHQTVKVVFNMGLWKHVIDINSIDKVIKLPPKKLKLVHRFLGSGDMLPISGMNNAFLAEIIPAYLLLPDVLVGDWKLSRHDDIWGGYILKRIIEKREEMVTFGEPIIFHAKESWQSRALYHEHYFHLLSHYFYQLVDEAMKSVEKNSYQEMFAQFVSSFAKVIKNIHPSLPPHYSSAVKALLKGMQWWVKLWQRLS